MGRFDPIWVEKTLFWSFFTRPYLGQIDPNKVIPTLFGKFTGLLNYFLIVKNGLMMMMMNWRGHRHRRFICPLGPLVWFSNWFVLRSEERGKSILPASGHASGVSPQMRTSMMAGGSYQLLCRFGGFVAWYRVIVHKRKLKLGHIVRGNYPGEITTSFSEL